MSLQFYLIPNHMTSDPDDYMAVSSNSETYTIEDVYEHMTREGSTITRAEALAGYEEVTQGIINLVREGNSVVTPLAHYSSSIKGVFRGEEDDFDASRHQVSVNMSTGRRMREVAGDIPVQKVPVRQRQPAPVHFHDNASESRDAIITPGRGARITGSLLKFNEEDPQQGIFFVNTADGSESRVASQLLRNKPGELIFVNPGLPAGTYRLEIRTTLGDTADLRTGALSSALTVANDG
ncbi:DNA-binding domain-containing protein [Fodinibius sediminis]|uniref:Uncharacterized protein n=1 Tax=Fodinibius sediminis TaxID=1214077 RepID=A0A521E7E3_9BACT|nr:DNA-binding domain-containing protein [Fodinibius sediminis]SMO79331.1 protein of unknown function [Fodinibius sediminis]